MHITKNFSEEGFVKNIKCSDSDFIIAVNKTISIAELLRYLNIPQHRGRHYESVKFKIKQLKLDTSHWGPYVKRNGHKRKDLKDILTIGTSICHLKRLLDENVLKNECYECGLIPYWKEKPLKLQIDHINGINTDNRLENLRLLCPNCHSQTDTFCGRNVTKRHKKPTCIDCNTQISRKSLRCTICQAKINKVTTKITWPETRDLIKMIENSSVLATSRNLKCSDAAVYKHLESRGFVVKNKKVYKD